MRGALVMPAAALAVHQLRYLLAYGGGARAELAAQGHAYLHSLTPWIVLAVCVALGSFLGRAARTFQGARPRGAAGAASLALLKVWLAASAALLAVYVGQELLEGWLASGHAPGLEGVLGSGGFYAVPAALWIGGLVALVLRGASAVLARLARARRATRRRLAAAVPRPSSVLLIAAPPLATAAAGRAPPRGS